MMIALWDFVVLRNDQKSKTEMLNVDDASCHCGRGTSMIRLFLD